MSRLKYVSVAGDGYAQLTLGELKCNKKTGSVNSFSSNGILCVVSKMINS